MNIYYNEIFVKLELFTYFSEWNIVFYIYSFARLLLFLEADRKVSHIINDVIELRNNQIELLNELVRLREFSKLDCFD